MGAHRQIGLDAVRGIAILCVVLSHFNQPVEILALDAALTPVRAGGWAGVELFFVLSGYLVGGMILSDCDTGRVFDWRRFALRRAYRLWPILYLYLFAMMLGGVDWASIWPTLLHLQNFDHDSRSHLWSLAVEEHFYLHAALTLPWLASRLTPRGLIAALVGLIVAVNVVRIGAVAGGVPWEHIHWQTQYRIDALAAGVLLAAVSRHYPDVIAAALRRRLLLVLAAVIGFATIALRIDFLLRWSIELTVAWVAAVPLVIAASDLPLRGAMTRPARALAALGRIAYPLYIWHISAGNIAALLAVNAGFDNPLMLAIVRMIAAIGVAMLLHHGVEQPFLLLRERAERVSRLSLPRVPVGIY